MNENRNEPQCEGHYPNEKCEGSTVPDDLWEEAIGMHNGVIDQATSGKGFACISHALIGRGSKGFKMLAVVKIGESPGFWNMASKESLDVAVSKAISSNLAADSSITSELGFIAEDSPGEIRPVVIRPDNSVIVHMSGVAMLIAFAPRGRVIVATSIEWIDGDGVLQRCVMVSVLYPRRDGSIYVKAHVEETVMDREGIDSKDWSKYPLSSYLKAMKGGHSNRTNPSNN